MEADLMQLFDEWAASYARGEQPDPLDYLERAGRRRDELAALMDGFLRAVPRAEPSEETIALTHAWFAGHSPLADLRARRGVRRDEVVDEVMQAFALPEARRAKVKRYYSRLERGLLDPARLSDGLLDVLARALRTQAATILDWRPRPLVADAAFRATGELPESLVTAARLHAPPLPEPEDEVDRLFLSGR